MLDFFVRKQYIFIIAVSFILGLVTYIIDGITLGNLIAGIALIMSFINKLELSYTKKNSLLHMNEYIVNTVSPDMDFIISEFKNIDEVGSDEWLKLFEIYEEMQQTILNKASFAKFSNKKQYETLKKQLIDFSELLCEEITPEKENQIKKLEKLFGEILNNFQ